MSDRIKEIRERVEKASKGRWRVSKGTKTMPQSVLFDVPTYHAIADVGSSEEGGSGEGDLHFIAHAREDVPYLLDLLAAKDAELAEWKAWGEMAKESIKNISSLESDTLERAAKVAASHFKDTKMKTRHWAGVEISQAIRRLRPVADNKQGGPK